jgi:amino-acid racemase
VTWLAAAVALRWLTRSFQRGRWRLHLSPRIGRKRLNDVTKSTVLSLRDELRAGGLAESSIGSVLVVLRSVFAYARQADYTTSDPFRGIRRGELPSPSESTKEKRVLRADEIRRLALEAAALEGAGAELIVLCTNTMHKVADAINNAISVPFVHIADTTAEAVRAAGFATVGLLATKYTMEQDFYRGRLEEKHGLRVLVPDEADRQLVHDVIYNELCRGVTSEQSRDTYRHIIRLLVGRGAECILLGCTEIDLLIDQGDSPVPIFDTTRIHAARAVSVALDPT